MPKHPRLAKRGNVFWFRAKVPVDLRATYAPKREITFSLKTSDPKLALEKVRIASVRVDQEFSERRRPKAAQHTLSDVEIDRLAAIFTHHLLAEDEEVRIDGTGDTALYRDVKHTLEQSGIGFVAGFIDGQNVPRGALTERDYQKIGETLDIVDAANRKALAFGDITAVADEVDELLETQGIALDKNSPAYRKLSHAILKAYVRAGELLARRQRGEVVDTPLEPSALSAASASSDSSIRFSALWERYSEERKLPPKTASDFGTYVRRFIEVNGDLAVNQVTKSQVRDFKDAMLRLPKTMTKALLAKTVPQVLEATAEQKDLPRLSVRTVNDKALGAVSAVFGYAVENGYRDDNPASGIKAVGPEIIEPARVAYTVGDLTTIFTSPVFTEGHRPVGGGKEAAKWLPLLALYTGARLEELGRLLVADVREEVGHSYFFLHTMGEGKRLKGRASRRKVPLHPELIRLGLMDYIAERRKAGDKALFPDLRSKRGEITAAFSTWWRRYQTSIGLTDKRKVFHSFRHSAKRALRDGGVDKTLRDALQGHAARDIAEAYGLDEEGLGVSLPVLSAAMAKLAYPGLDLEHLVPASRRADKANR